MRVIHVSDTHGVFRKLNGKFDVVVHSGDLLADPRDRAGDYGMAQLKEFEVYIREFKKWLEGHPVLITLGNHDWVNAELFEQRLKDFGIEAYLLHDKIVEFENVKFYGFPYVPAINGRFSYERVVDQMVQHVDEMANKINVSYVDVIVAHCPPAGCLDLAIEQNRRFGNTSMATGLDYKIDPDMLPSFYLTGHIHSSHAITNRNGMIVSNAATTQHILEV